MENENTDFSKFENCKYRSKRQLIKTSCCSKKISAFKCLKKNIIPLSPIKHCLTCEDFVQEI
jgi:hypothetical protein